MKRREFIIVIVIGGTAAAWSLAASAERAARVPPVKQIRLTERQIQGFIAAQKEMAVVAESRQREPRPESVTVAKKNGFKDFAEYDEVAANILMVFAGMDPQSKQYTDPQTAIKKRLRRSSPIRRSLKLTRTNCCMNLKSGSTQRSPFNIPATSSWSGNTTTGSKNIWANRTDDNRGRRAGAYPETRIGEPLIRPVDRG
jgi:hypothetical protein